MNYKLFILCALTFLIQAGDARPDISKQGLLYFFSAEEAEQFASEVHEKFSMIDENTLVEEAEGLYFRPGNDVSHFRWRHGPQAQYRAFIEDLTDEETLALEAYDLARAALLMELSDEAISYGLNFPPLQ